MENIANNIQGLKEYLNKQRGIKEEINKLIGLGEEIIEASQNRNNAAHGSKAINEKEAKRDKCIVYNQVLICNETLYLMP